MPHSAGKLALAPAVSMGHFCSGPTASAEDVFDWLHSLKSKDSRRSNGEVCGQGSANIEADIFIYIKRNPKTATALEKLGPARSKPGSWVTRYMSTESAALSVSRVSGKAL